MGEEHLHCIYTIRNVVNITCVQTTCIYITGDASCTACAYKFFEGNYDRRNHQKCNIKQRNPNICSFQTFMKINVYSAFCLVQEPRLQEYKKHNFSVCDKVFLGRESIQPLSIILNKQEVPQIQDGCQNMVDLGIRPKKVIVMMETQIWCPGQVTFSNI